MPWNKIGKSILGSESWEEAAALAGLDWEVEKRQLESRGILIPAYGLFRSDNQDWLNKVGKDFKPIQNKELFSWVDCHIKKEKASYVSAGYMQASNFFWCLVQLREEIDLLKAKDRIEIYLLLQCSQPNKLILKFRNCSAILNFPLKGINPFLDLEGTINHLKENLNQIEKTTLFTQALGEIFREVFPAIENNAAQQNKARDVLEILRGSTSAYSLLTAFLSFSDHRLNTKQAAFSALFGSGELFKIRVFDSVSSYCQK